MGYLFAAYWPFMVAVFVAGIAVGWWSQDPHSVDDMTAWLERGPEER